MKNIMKIMFVVFGSFALLSSANAGPVDVTGTAKVTYNIAGGDSTTAANNKGKAIGITNELAFTGTGETDQGWTWKYQVELDDNASGVTTFDDTRLEITTGMGAVAFYNTEGSLAAKYKQSHAAYGVGSDNGSGGLFQWGSNIGGYNNVQLHTAADSLPYSTSVKVGFSPSGSAAKVSGNSAGTLANASGSSVVEYQVQTTPIDGLTISGSYFEKNDEGGLQKYQVGVAGASYTYGNLSLGITRGGVSNNVNSTVDGIAAATALTATTVSNVKGFENDAWSIGYAVNDALSVSYGEEKSTANKRTLVGSTAADTELDVDLKVTTMQAAYTMGGFTTFLMAKDIENEAYASGVDQKETIIGMTMAF
jgi:hypothetical protein